MHHNFWHWNSFHQEGMHALMTPGGIFMGILLIVIIGIIIYLLVSRSRDRQEYLYHSTQDRKPHNTENDAIHILKTRYAKGEISEEEFEHMKRNLS